MKNKRQTLIALAVAAIAALTIGIFVFNSAEPVWKGRRLGAWLNDFDADVIEKRLRAAEAIRQIGSNAVPFLIPRLEHPEFGPISPWSGLETRIRFLLSKQRFIRILPPPPTSPRHQALAAIDALGPAAKEALPALEKLLHETPPDPDVIYIIARIGPPSFPLLKQSLTNDERLIRMEARLCLDNCGSHSDMLFPAPGMDTSEFDRRLCELHLRMMGAALSEYKRQHPEMGFPSNITDTPPPSPVPPGFPRSARSASSPFQPE